MPFRPALCFSYPEFSNFFTYEEVRQHTNWPVDAAPPQVLRTTGPNHLRNQLLITSNQLLRLARERHPLLNHMLSKLEEHSSIFDTENFKIYLALKGSYESWTSGHPLPHNVIYRELIRVTPRVRACATSILRLTRILPGYLRNSFSREEKAYGSLYTSDSLRDILISYHAQYHDVSDYFLYPYTAIVGPSEKGKTFSVSRLAVKHHKYVIYLNFKHPQLPSYPHTTCLAHDFLEYLKHHDTAYHQSWSRLVGGLLRLTRVVRHHGIGPMLFFLIQTDPDYAPQQVLLRDFVMSVVKTGDWDQFDLDCRKFVQDVLNIRCLALLPYRPPEVPRLQFIVCIDGASGLLKEYDSQDQASPSPLFHSLRCALKDLTATEKNFFATFVDKSAEITTLFPAFYRDPIQRPPNDRLECRRLFPPFFELPSRNPPLPRPVVLAPAEIMSLDNILDSKPQVFNGDRHVFRVPQIPPPKPNFPIVSLPVRSLSPEISGQQVGMLAMLCYRIEFDITNFDLAEKLVFERLFDIVAIPTHREQLQVTPPDDSTIPGLIAMWNPYEPPFNYRDALGIFKHVLHRQFVNIDRLEFVAGLISLVARYAVMDDERRDEDFGTIDVESFLTKMFGESVVGKLKPTSSPVSRYDRMIISGKLSFQRISRRQSLTCIQDIYEMYRKCTAAFLPTGSTAGNIMIPVWVPSCELRPAHIGCIIIRVQACGDRVFVSPGKDEYYIRNAVARYGFEDKVPIVGLTMYLNGCENFSNNVVVTKGQLGRHATVVAVGLDSHVYPLFRPSFPTGSMSVDELQGILGALQDVASPYSDVPPTNGGDSMEI